MTNAVIKPITIKEARKKITQYRKLAKQYMDYYSDTYDPIQRFVGKLEKLYNTRGTNPREELSQWEKLGNILIRNRSFTEGDCVTRQNALMKLYYLLGKEYNLPTLNISITLRDVKIPARKEGIPPNGIYSLTRETREKLRITVTREDGTVIAENVTPNLY